MERAGRKGGSREASGSIVVCLIGGWRCILRGIMLLPLTYAPQSLGFVCIKWGICVHKVGDLCALLLTYAPLPLSYGRARPRLRFGLVASLWVATTLKGRLPLATATT